MTIEVDELRELGYTHANDEHYIYGIFNTVTLEVYVGSTNNFSRRTREHLSELRHGRHKNWKLQRAFRHDGEVAFEFHVMKYVTLPFDRHDAEQYFLDEMPKYYTLYNLMRFANPQGAFAERGRAAAMRRVGIARSDEVKEKIRAKLIGKKRPPEVVAKMSKALIGRPPKRPEGWITPTTTPVPELDRDKIREMRSRGIEWNDIAAELGYSIGVIMRVKREMNLWSKPSKLAKLKSQN